MYHEHLTQSYRVPLSLRLVEEMPVGAWEYLCPTRPVRRWALKFGRNFARHLKRKQPSRGDIWHLDEVVVGGVGKPHWLCEVGWAAL